MVVSTELGGHERGQSTAPGPAELPWLAGRFGGTVEGKCGRLSLLCSAATNDLRARAAEVDRSCSSSCQCVAGDRATEVGRSTSVSYHLSHVRKTVGGSPRGRGERPAAPGPPPCLGQWRVADHHAQKPLEHRVCAAYCVARGPHAPGWAVSRPRRRPARHLFEVSLRPKVMGGRHVRVRAMSGAGTGNSSRSALRPGRRIPTGLHRTAGRRERQAAAAFLGRTKGWFAAHGITHIHRVVTDNGACCRSGGFACIVGAKTRNQHAKPCTPSPAPHAATARSSVTRGSWPRGSSTPAHTTARTNA